MASVRLEKVRKVYDGQVIALHETDLEINDKEFVVLVGPSGCGKSTTLRMIAGLEQTSNGKIFIDDRIVNDIPPKDRDIAMVFQNYALYPHMNVYENMSFGLKLRKFNKKEIDTRVQETAAILGIQELLDRKPKALSGGQRQRVALGRAIVRKPKVFLFDEPLSNLDAKLRVQMRTEISKLHRSLQTTMIYVTHDQTEAMTMAERIILMKDGKIQQIDSPLRMYNNPENILVAGFIGSPAMNFFHGTIQRSRHLSFALQGNALGLPIDKAYHTRLKAYIGKEVVLGLRPEHIFTSGNSANAMSKAKVTVNVALVEPMGNEIFLYFSVPMNENQYIARIAATESLPVGKSTDLIFDMSKARFFDAHSEKTI